MGKLSRSSWQVRKKINDAEYHGSMRWFIIVTNTHVIGLSCKPNNFINHRILLVWTVRIIELRNEEDIKASELSSSYNFLPTVLDFYQLVFTIFLISLLLLRHWNFDQKKYCCFVTGMGFFCKNFDNER